MELSRLREGMSGLRLCEASALESVRRSLDRHGQLQAVTVTVPEEAADDPDALQVIDGFKRLRAARSLGWRSLRGVVEHVDAVAAKVRIAELHSGQALTALEEGWLIRALHRDDGLTQGAIAARLGRHKTWVCRRLLLVEQLESDVQLDVRRGLLSVRAAIQLGLLPRGNQRAAAMLVLRQGLSVRQTSALVAELTAATSVEEQRCVVQRWSSETKPTSAAVNAKARSDVELLLGDVAVLTRVCGRLHGRLGARPLDALGEQPRELVRRGLEGLQPVLDALSATIETGIASRLREASESGDRRQEDT